MPLTPATPTIFLFELACSQNHRVTGHLVAYASATPPPAWFEDQARTFSRNLKRIEAAQRCLVCRSTMSGDWQITSHGTDFKTLQEGYDLLSRMSTAYNANGEKVNLDAKAH